MADRTMAKEDYRTTAAKEDYRTTMAKEDYRTTAEENDRMMMEEDDRTTAEEDDRTTAEEDDRTTMEEHAKEDTHSGRHDTWTGWRSRSVGYKSCHSRTLARVQDRAGQTAVRAARRTLAAHGLDDFSTLLKRKASGRIPTRSGDRGKTWVHVEYKESKPTQKCQLEAIAGAGLKGSGISVQVTWSSLWDCWEVQCDAMVDKQLWKQVWDLLGPELVSIRNSDRTRFDHA